VAKTDELIDQLARDLRPVPAGALDRLLAWALLPGIVLSGALIFFAHGFRPDLAAAVHLPAFWVKSFYPFALALSGFVAMKIVARPGGVPLRAGLASLAIYLILVALALVQLQTASAADYPRLIFGISYWFCPLIILVAALPVFAANIWFLRRSAPTHFYLSGFVAGMTAGAAGAWTYSWGCIENGLTFVAIWYSLGILLCGLVGAALGPRLLRW
jgi:hypothetical protein